MADVIIVMGSDSDLSVMKNAAELLEEFGVSFEMRILSAHRTPDAALCLAREARSKGAAVIIAGAGGAAHLAGVLASETILPVIAVPIPGGTLGGLDALLSMVQMPSGVPVATVAIGGARNAAILAVQILAGVRPQLAERLETFKKEMADAVVNKDRKLSDVGWRSYVS